MRVTKRMKKAVSSLLALSMVLSYVPVPGFAEEVCTHHAHDKACGYVEAVEGKSCTHQCTESCPKKDVTVCVHDHVKLGCAHTPAVEGVACDHVHGEACGYVPAQAAVPCTCGAVAAHTAQCASLVTEGAECDCGMPTLHAEGCEPKAAVAEQCSHVHGACAYKAAVRESWGCGHVCTKDSGCVKAVCAHAHDASCGYVQAVKGSDCTFVCTECKAEEKTCTCESTDPGEHAPFCDLYVRTYEECKCVLDCAVEGRNDWCETCYFEGVAACTGGEEENVTFESGTIGELSYTLDESGELTISGPGAIPANAFGNNEEISVVIIVEGVTSIGANAFRDCSNLISVTIPGSVKTIDNTAFYGCSSLESVSIPSSVTSIGNYAFSGCISLTTVEYWGKSKPTASSSVFSGCSSLSVIKVHKDYTSDSFAGKSVDPVLGNSSTPDDTNTYTITFDPTGGTLSGTATATTGADGKLPAMPDDPIREGFVFAGWFDAAIGGNEVTTSTVFAADSTVYAQWTESVLSWIFDEVTNTLTIYNDSAMGSYEKPIDVPWAIYEDEIQSVEIRSGVTSISKFAFYGCSSLSSVSIPDTVTVIGWSAFNGCSSLNSVTIPASVTTIGSSAFYLCSGLTSVSIPSGVTKIDVNTFAHCSNLTDVTIPNNVTTISQSAFEGCSSLTSITIPGSVTEVDNFAFLNCSDLENVEYLGIDQPSAGSDVFSGIKATIAKVPADYEANYFCGLPVEKPATTYTITIDTNITNGTVVAAKETATEGETIFLTVTPNEDFVLSTLFYSYNNTTENVTENADGTYSFVMPASDVQITAHFMYPVYVQGVAVTSQNAADVLEDGTVSYNAETNTLTLNGANIEGASINGSTYTVGIFAPDGLNLYLGTGGATISNCGYGIDVSDDLSISGGSLEIRECIFGIASTSYDNICIESGTITITSNQSAINASIYGQIIINGGTVRVTSQEHKALVAQSITFGNGVRVIARGATAAMAGTPILASGVSCVSRTTENGVFVDGLVYNDDYYFELSSNGIPVTGITLIQDTLAMEVNESFSLTAIITPDNAANKAVTWNSSNPDVATVDQTGKVTAVRAGTVTITVTTSDGGYTDTCTVTVQAHSHNWNYEAKDTDSDGVNDTIFANCTTDNCQLDEKNGGSVTISASDAIYDGAAKAATATSENWLADNVSIQYRKHSGETWDVATSTAPTDAGIYKASITLDTATVSVEYTITPLEIKDEHVVLTPSSAVYDGTVKNTDIMVVVDGKTIDSLNYEVTGLDALGSAIGEYPITITGKGNYTGTVTKNFEITTKQLSEASVTLTANLTYHGEAQEPAITVKDGNTELSRTSDYTVSYEKVNENSSATPIQGAPVDAGHYNAIITGKGSYGGEIRKSFEIKPNTSIDVAPTELDDEVYTGEEIKPAVQVTGVKLTALEKDKDYTIVYENNTNAGEAKITITGIGNYAGAKKELTFTITAKALTEANVTIGETILGYEEGKTTVPEITVKDGSKTLTAGTDYVVTYLDKDGQKVDAPSAVGIYTVQVIGIADLSEDGSGNYSGTVSKTFVITDDVTAPEITGVTNGKTYYTTQKVTARDENLVSVTKNGTAITPVVATGTEVALEGNQTATYTVAAVDIAENESAITITMKPISSLDDTIENLTTENVKLSDKDAIEDVLNAVKSIRESECGNATQTEKNALDAIISKCDDLLKVITDAENAISKIQALPNPAETAPDNETAVKAYDAAKKAYDALSEHGKELVGAENKAKLDAMLKALTSYDVIKGHKSSYTRGSGKTFSLTANGYFGKFTGLKIDGKILDSKYYTAKSGSTIVTLKNSYLDSLSDGKHTVEFLYTDGSTGGDHYFRISTNNGSPFTGDNNHIMMFGGIMMTSLLCMVMMVMFVPKKKGKFQR